MPNDKIFQSFEPVRPETCCIDTTTRVKSERRVEGGLRSSHPLKSDSPGPAQLGSGGNSRYHN
jgi:hypothetical protein